MACRSTGRRSIWRRNASRTAAGRGRSPQDDFKISTTIAGVNMRLGPGGVRELHWHQQAEWAIMTLRHLPRHYSGPEWASSGGRCEGRRSLVFSGRLCRIRCRAWSPDGCEFVIAFDNGNSSEFNTLLVTDWIAHTPPEVLAKNFGVPVEAFKNIPLHNRWIYQSDLQAPPLDAVEAQMAAVAGKPPNPFVFRLGDMAPNRETKSGTVRIADSTNFLVSKTVAASHGHDQAGWHARNALASQCR